MKTPGKNKKENEKGRSFQDTMDFLYRRLSKYDKSHENFIVPWQMDRKEREYNF